MNQISPEVAESMFGRGAFAAFILLVGMAITIVGSIELAGNDKVGLARIVLCVGAVLALGAVIAVIGGVFAGFLTAVSA